MRYFAPINVVERDLDQSDWLLNCGLILKLIASVWAVCVIVPLITGVHSGTDMHAGETISVKMMEEYGSLDHLYLYHKTSQTSFQTCFLCSVHTKYEYVDHNVVC